MKAALLLALLSMGGCAAVPVVSVADCDWARPVLVSGESVGRMSDDTARAILSWNEEWSARCE